MDADADIARAVEALRRGGLVAFPTETVYGLGADASNLGALRRLYAVKGRPPRHPVIVHLADSDQLGDWARAVPPEAQKLAGAFWPGPLTLVLPRRRERVPVEVTGGLDTVGLRVPDQPLALRLLRAFGRGIAAPSANRFGNVSPTTAADVRADLGADVDVILDGGRCAVGVESTIVDCSGDGPAILRLGGLPREQVEEIAGSPVPVRDDGTARAPGTLRSHYAPNAKVVLVAAPEVAARATELLSEGKRVGVLAPSDIDALPAALVVLEPPGDAAEYARVLYSRLREADRQGLHVLLVVAPPEKGIGAAVTDRLRRAAGAAP
jgi:L-threonylcarbamoyladenylate synthase